MNYRVPTQTPPPLVRLYWPTTLTQRQQQQRRQSSVSGWLIGWYTHTAPLLHTLCVATLVDDSKHTLADINACLDQLAANHRLAAIWRHAGGTPVILGRIEPNNNNSNSNEHRPARYSTHHNLVSLLQIHASLPPTSRLPLIHAIHSNSSASSAALDWYHCQLILFTLPQRGTFIAATPFPFRSAFSSSASQPHSEDEETEEAEADVVRLSGERCSDLTLALRQINSCWKVQDELNITILGSATNQKPSPSSSSSSSSSFCHSAHSSLSATLLRPILSLFAVLAVVARYCVAVLECPLPSSLSYLSSQPTTRPRLQDISTFASQLRFRLLTLLHWPALYRSSQLPPSPSAAYHASSLLLWSSVGSVVMDLILGVLLCRLLHHHAATVVSLLHHYSHLLHTSFIASTVTHFQQQPAGLKLHPHLSHLFTQYVHTTLSLYSALVGGWLSGEVAVGWLASVGWLGASLLFAVCSDALSVLTAHVDLLHTSFSLCYRVFLALLSSLFLLFRGKKRNLLRVRIDSLSPSTSVLLLGVLLFCVVLLLLPTVIVYYVFFASVRLLLMGGQAMLWWLLATCNCFPWVGLAVWLLRRGGLPGGVHLEHIASGGQPQAEDTVVGGDGRVEAEEEDQETVVRREMSAASPADGETVLRYRHVMELEWSSSSGRAVAGVGVVCDCVRLVSVSVPLRALFFQYRVALSYLQRHYNAKQLVMSLLRGQRLPTAPPSSAALAVSAWGVDNTSGRKHKTST